MIKRVVILFMIGLGALIPLSGHAQAGPRYIEDAWNGGKVSGTIFKTNHPTVAFSDNIFRTATFTTNTPVSTLEPINGPGTPKTAIFCRFENTLWRNFGHSVRLRVENVPR